MRCEVLASIELGMRRRSDLRMIAWPEILAKAPEGTRRADRPYQLSAGDGLASVVPDAIFGIEYPRDARKAYRFFALEADRATMPIGRSNGHQTSYMTKLAAYRSILALQVHKTQLSLPNLLVLTITTSEPRKSEIMHRVGEQAGDNASFLLKAVGCTVVPAFQLLDEPWERVGFPSLHIATA